MMKRLVLMALLIASPAAADDSDSDAVYKAMIDMVQLAPRDPNSDDCAVKGTVNFALYSEKVEMFRDAFLNRDQSIDFYNQRRKQVFSYILLKRIAEFITEGFYNGHSQLECKFALSVLYPDKFGQDRNFEALTWRFNNDQSAKVNWSKFDPRDFDKIALDYTLSSRIQEWVADEPSMADQQRAQPEPQTTCDMLLFNANALFIRATAFCRKD